MNPQTQYLYQTLLSSSKPLSARKLASILQILPNAVYRLTEPLIKTGLIIKINKYPYQFIAKPVDEGLSLHLLNQYNWFSQRFFQLYIKKDLQEKGEILQSQHMKLSFIQGRDELMNLSVGEINKANKSVDLLRSGHEIPADVMLSLINAKKRSVLIRMIIQDYSKENAEQITFWKKNGIQVRKTSLRYIRLMLYYSNVVYFMSYKHVASEKDQGMKICYPPFAAIITQLFDQWWH